MKTTIGIEGLRLYAYHGYYSIERETGREFSMDVYIQVDWSEDTVRDEIKDTVNYEQALEICQAEMAIPSKLLETVAHRTAHALISRWPSVLQVNVRISKKQPLLPIALDRFFVEIQMP
jgi:7,8-dihydroneopterin aldolase/epimerase/oxygenase